MPIPRYTPKDTVRMGKDLYEKSIRSIADTSENFGKVLVIDVESGDYEIDQNNMTALQRIFARKPDAQIYAMRIGFPALGKMGGAWATGFAKMRAESPK